MKSKPLNLSVIKLFYIVLIFSLLCPAVSSAQYQAINSLNITAKLYNPKDDSLMDLTSREMKLTSQKIIWKEGDSIQKLLEANLFWTDGESVGILYKLDPDLNAKSLKAGKEIILPAVKNKEEFSREFDKGYLVWLTLDDDLKQEFCRASKELSALPAKTSGLDVRHFESPGERDSFVKATESIVETMMIFGGVIKDRQDPLDSDMVTQMLTEAEQAKSIILNTINGKQKLSKSDAQTLDLIEKNMTKRQALLKEEKGDEEDKKLPALAQTIERVLWNAWFEDVKGSYVGVLKPTNDYFFTLDVSRFSYFKDYKAVVDLSLQNLINKAHENGETQITFIIRPILFGDVARFVENKGQSRVLEKELVIDINQLVKLKDESAETEKKSMHEAYMSKKEYKSKKLTLRQLATAVQAGEVKFKMKVVKPGTAELSISIWDQSGMIPLDHLNVPIQVLDPKVPEEKRSITKHTVPFKAGRGTLLDVSFDFSSTAPLVADAAFHIFEPSPNGFSMVLFAAKTDKGISVNAWETESLLSEYIEKSDQLIVQIRYARKRAVSSIENERKYSYQLAAEGLRKKIFGGLEKRDREQAADAEKVFRDLVQKKELKSIVFVRMVKNDGNPVYLPLGILAASSSTPFLNKRIILVQPLRREHYPAGVHPVWSWTFNVPKELADLSAISTVALNKLSKDPPYRRDISVVKDYFEGKKETAPPSPGPEGVLLLAHQAGGNLWFTNQAIGIVSEDIKRSFPASSVAILSACSTASTEGNNQAILRKLNRNGIDAMIVSPFPVHADYGVMLAINFVKAIEEARDKKKALSLAELFSTATAQTSVYFSKERSMHFDDMDLEFLIAGDYRIKLAPK